MNGLERGSRDSARGQQSLAAQKDGQQGEEVRRPGGQGRLQVWEGLCEHLCSGGTACRCEVVLMLILTEKGGFPALQSSSSPNTSTQ